MKNLVKVLLIASVVVFTLSACRTSPIINIDNSPINISQKHGSEDIKKAIFRAAASLGWLMDYKKNGHIIGTLNIRTHVAVVDITYDKKSYSIKYKDSQNLNYDGINIHRNYNQWVSKLNKNINVQLNVM